MDARQEIRDFLVSRRARITPERSEDVLEALTRALQLDRAYVRNGRLDVLATTADEGSTKPADRPTG